MRFLRFYILLYFLSIVSFIFNFILYFPFSTTFIHLLFFFHALFVLPSLSSLPFHNCYPLKEVVKLWFWVLSLKQMTNFGTFIFICQITRLLYSHPKSFRITIITKKIFQDPFLSISSQFLPPISPIGTYFNVRIFTQLFDRDWINHGECLTRAWCLSIEIEKLARFGGRLELIYWMEQSIWRLEVNRMRYSCCGNYT